MSLHQEPLPLLLFSLLWKHVDIVRLVVVNLAVIAEYVGTVSRLYINNLLSLSTANIDANARVARRVQLVIARLLTSPHAQVLGLVAALERAHTSVAARRLFHDLLTLLTVNVNVADYFAVVAAKAVRNWRRRRLSFLDLLLVGCSAHLLITM